MYCKGRNFPKHVRNWFFVRVYKVGGKFFTGSVNEIKFYRGVCSMRQFRRAIGVHV